MNAYLNVHYVTIGPLDKKKKN